MTLTDYALATFCTLATLAILLCAAQYAGEPRAATEQAEAAAEAHRVKIDLTLTANLAGERLRMLLEPDGAFILVPVAQPAPVASDDAGSANEAQKSSEGVQGTLGPSLGARVGAWIDGAVARMRTSKENTTCEP